MYGRYPILPIDVEFGVTLPDLMTAKKQNYAQKLKAHLKWAFKTAKEVNDKEAAQHKKYYDQRFKCIKIEPGDLVLVRVKAFGSDHKIADRWEQVPHKVLSQLHGSPVYKVQTLDKEGEDNIQVLYRNMLFPFQTEKIESDIIGSSQAVLLVRANQLMEEYFD